MLSKGATIKVKKNNGKYLAKIITPNITKEKHKVKVLEVISPTTDYIKEGQNDTIRTNQIL